MSELFNKLIDLTLSNDDNTGEVLDKISVAWELPNKHNQFRFKSKLYPFITMTTLHEALLYSFQTDLQLKPIKSHPNQHIKPNQHYESDTSDKSLLSIQSESETSLSNINFSLWSNTEWICNIYIYLIQSLTLRQKAYLFSIGSDRRTRKYHIVHKYKNCIVGHEGIDWMLTHLMASNRLEAIELGNQFIQYKLLYHVCKEHSFKDGEFWYYFNDELIQDHNSPIPKFEKHSQIIHGLISFTITPDTETEIISDVKNEFTLPEKTNIKKQMFCAKYINNICFNTIIEVVQFMLTELWGNKSTQNIYNKLVKLLSETQKAYLFSIGVETKDRKYHLKTYNNCFIGKEAVKWLKTVKFVETDKEATELGNKFLWKGYLEHFYKEHGFKNEFLFYIFHETVINKALTTERYIVQTQSVYSNHKIKVSDINEELQMELQAAKATILAFQQNEYKLIEETKRLREEIQQLTVSINNRPIRRRDSTVSESENNGPRLRSDTFLLLTDEDFESDVNEQEYEEYETDEEEFQSQSNT